MKKIVMRLTPLRSAENGLNDMISGKVNTMVLMILLCS